MQLLKTLESWRTRENLIEKAAQKGRESPPVLVLVTYSEKNNERSFKEITQLTPVFAPSEKKLSNPRKAISIQFFNSTTIF